MKNSFIMPYDFEIILPSILDFTCWDLYVFGLELLRMFPYIQLNLF